MATKRDIGARVTFGGLSFDVKYNYSPGTPDVFYLPNGDPGYPGDPEEFEVTELRLCDERTAVAYLLEWPDGTSAVRHQRPTDLTPDCKVTELVRRGEMPCLMDSLADLQVDPSILEELVANQLEKEAEDEEPPRDDE